MPPVDDQKAADKKEAEKKAADAEKASVSQAAAIEAAQSVADAVKRVADAAVAEVQKTAPVAQQDFSFTGSPGGKFTIRGTGFSGGGTLTINGVQALTNEWGNEYIAGKMPEGVKAGQVAVEVIIDSTTRQRGSFKI